MSLNIHVDDVFKFHLLCINVLLDQTLVHNFCSEPKFIIHHYKRSFNGFVAKLTKAEADKMAGVCRDSTLPIEKVIYSFST